MKEQETTLWPGWETVRMIGKGSFGTVYEIQRDMFGDIEKAALKVISIPQNPGDIDEMYNDGYDDESITSTFQSHLKSIVAEYSLMRKMNGSSNIVNCDDVRYVQHEDGVGWDIFIKMELLTPLAKALPNDVPEGTVIQVARDMCAALERCAKHNIIHRDIKPQNIFVSPNGDYKLGDFGIAKTVEKTMGGTKIGTYKYMAPEVYNNRPYGAAADIYSLGLVLYWLLNERRMPFLPLPPAKLSMNQDEDARYRRLSGEQIPAPKNGSAALKAIVLKACAFNPADRYQTAEEMLTALEATEKGETSAVAPPAIPVVEETPVEEDRTVGPVWTKTPTVTPAAPDDDATVGPVFGKAKTAGNVRSVTSEMVKTNARNTDDSFKIDKVPIAKSPAQPDVQKKSTGFAFWDNMDKKQRRLIRLCAIALAVLIICLLMTRACGRDTTSNSNRPSKSNDIDSTYLPDTLDNVNNSAESGQNSANHDEPITPETVTEPEVTYEYYYEIIKDDVSWTEAKAACEAKGGYLATITSAEEYNEICELADESGLIYLWLGAYLPSTDMSWDEATWITGEAWAFDNWYPGEPSMRDEDGTPEHYLCMWYMKNYPWTFNDQRNDIVEKLPTISGKVGYVCEYRVVVEQ